MIVRDEAAVIERCLASVRPYIDYWVIVDTGSIDDTPARIRAALADIPGELYHCRWRDFGFNRSDALERARGKADYLLFLDADEQLLVDEDGTWPPSAQRPILWRLVSADSAMIGSVWFARRCPGAGLAYCTSTSTPASW
ncbi:glycosyltransferase [Kineobactrum salinum]|uniref:glycosyltransferase n=1 Tax=Kineobactrum salinum TaxID=2708301 RepID=UPI0018D8965E|nr:glycosyltransferase [Kineobactrum salinum]